MLPCDIDRRDIGLSESEDTLLRRFAGHALGAIRSRINVTMSACLIAELADIDLKDGDPGGAKREQADAIELRLEGAAAHGPSEYLQLLRGEARGFCCPSRVSAIEFI